MSKYFSKRNTFKLKEGLPGSRFWHYNSLKANCGQSPMPKFTTGFTLIETFVAITVLAFVIISPLSIASNGIITALYSKDQVTAYYLAEEAIEYIRNVRDSNHLQGLSSPANWLTGLSACISPNVCAIDSINNTVMSSTYCGASSCPVKYSNGIYAYTSGWGNSIFTRDIEIVTTSTTEVAVYVTLKWKTSTLPQRTFKIKENIHNWQL